MADAGVVLLKLVATPLFMAAVTLAGRRFGPAVGGWLTGLPLTSGPVSFFLALEQGRAFAAAAIPATLAGFVAFLVFCGVAAWLAPRTTWVNALLAALAVYAVAELAVLPGHHLFWPWLALAAATIAWLFWLLRRPAAIGALPAPPKWDLWVRMGTATGLVFLVTFIGDVAGPDLAGVLAPIPFFTSVLFVFTHLHGGGAAGREVLRGLIAGALSFCAFFLVLGVWLVPLGFAAYLWAALAAMVVNAATMPLIRRAPSVVGE